MTTEEPLFKEFSDEDINFLTRFGKTRTFSAGKRVFNQADEGNSVYFIQKGQVKIFTEDENGKESIIRYQKAGEYFGEVALIDAQPRSATVETIVYCEFKIVSKQMFKNCLAEKLSLANQLIPALTDRIRNLTEELELCKTRSAYFRLRSKLHKLAVKQKDGTFVVERPLTQQELGNLIGATRETISKIEKELKIGGYIFENSKRQIVFSKRLPVGF